MSVFKLGFLAISLLMIGYVKAETPSWLSDVSKGCSSGELCAVGTGDSRIQAEVNARAELAKIFQNKISATFKSKLEAVGSSVSDDLSEEIIETTQMALDGVEIKKHHEDKLNFYALALIDKKKAAKGFKTEITKLDNEIDAYMKDSSGSTVVKAEKAFIKRESLAKNYEFLSGGTIHSKITFEQIFKNKRDVLGKIIAHVYLDEDEPKPVESLLVTLLTEAGYKVTTGKERSKYATHTVTGDIVADKKHMNVDGFEKFDIIINLSAKNSSKVETGHLNFTAQETGRNYSQAYAKAEEKIKGYLKENLMQLNIE